MKVSSVGSQNDIREGTNLLETVPFFRSREEVGLFITQGVLNILPSLPMRLRYIDFGGGQGFLTKHVRDALVMRGYEVTAIVADSNVQFLMEAQLAGLQVVPVNLEQSSFENADLITMRLVNHYNSAQTQRAIMSAAFSALNPGGYLISQIETGSPISCNLRNEIAEYLTGRDQHDTHYYWVSEVEYRSWLGEIGFVADDKQVASSVHESCVDSIVKLAWERMHGGVHAHARASSATSDDEVLKKLRAQSLVEVNKIVEAYWHRHGDDPEGLYRCGDVFMLRASCPIIICRKS